MGYWILWLIGILITIATRIAINVLTRYNRPHRFRDIYKDSSKKVQVVIHLLIIICIIIVGGIPNGTWIGLFTGNDSIIVYIFIGFIPAILTYAVGYYVLGLYHFKKFLSQFCFISVFIISIIAWSISIREYNLEYQRNIETTTETIVKQTEDRKLLYFCNIPLQEISGTISGSASGSFLHMRGSISGEISTYDNLPYWYLNENGEGIYDNALSTNSKIIFIEEDQSPYLKIITYCTNETTTNHNNDTENTITLKEWTDYHFYLPDTIMQYNLN